MMSATARLVALAFAVGWALPDRDASARAPDSEWDVADRLAADGDHGQAAEHYARAYEETAAVAILYSWAQSARLAGDCETAVDLYARFGTLGATPPEAYDTEALRARWNQMLGNAQAQRAVCAERIAAAAETSSADREASSIPGESTPREAAVERPAADEMPETDASLPVEANTRPVDGGGGSRRPDPLGWTLVGGGTSIALAGAALVAASAVRDARAGRDGTHDDFLAELRRARIEQTIGYSALGAGVAFVVGGAIRLGLRARRRRAGLDRVALGSGLSFRF